ncbi:MAG: hypothetical protein RBR71_11245 [Gudongella sp.]|nr:hypothetical protein [Gudongella sp.]
MKIAELTKTVEKINLKEEMSLEELNDFMMENTEKLPAKFKLKKSIIGKAILFDTNMQVEPRVTVKDKEITIRYMENSTSVGIGNAPSLDFKDLKQRAKAVKEGGFGKAVTGGPEYFISICDAMVELLKPYTE